MPFAEKSLTEAGRELGLEFHFEKLGALPSTSEAHRLVQLAADEGRHANVAAAHLPRLLRTRRGHRRSSRCSRRSAPRRGSSERRCRPSARRARATPLLAGSEERLRGFGVRTVPNLLFGGRVLVPGTVNVATYVHALDQALFPGRATKTRRQADAALTAALSRAALPFWRLPPERATLTAACRRPVSRSDLRAIVGEQGMLEGAAVRERGAALFHGRVDAELLVRPRNTEQVSAVLKLCHARGQPVVTHGGLTGLVNGADAGRGDIVLSLEAMNAIERVDVPGPHAARAGRREARTACNARPKSTAWCFRSISARATARRSAATSRPTPAACACCATG